MRVLHVTVNNKVATYLQRDGSIVCGNNDYSIKFTFDSEWDVHTEKTARFIWNGRYYDQVFSGDTCVVPIITNADEVLVGVYAGDLNTTTRARIPCERSILCGVAKAQESIVIEYEDSAIVSAEQARASAISAAESAAQAKASADIATEAAEAIAQLVNDYIIEIDTLIGG